MFKTRGISSDVLVQMVGLLKQKLPIGVAPTTADWAKVYEITWAQNCLETIEFKTKWGLK